MRLFRVDLDARQQPVLLKGEVERATLQNAELHFEGVSGVEGFLIDSKYSGGYALLTSYRLVWVPYAPAATTFDPAACHLPLGAVADAALARAFLSLKPARVKVNLRVDAARYPCSDPLAVAGNVKLRMVSEKESSRAVDAFFSALQAALGSQAWRRAPQGLIQEMHTPQQAGAAAGGRGGGGAGPMTPPPSLLKSLSAAEGRGGQHLTPAGSRPFADPAMLAQLRQMGYPEAVAAEALAATGNASAQAAANWILDQPPPPPGPAVSGPLGGAAAGFAPAGPFAAAAAEAAAAADSSVVQNPLLQAHRLPEPLTSAGSSMISASSSQQQQRTPQGLQRTSASGVGVGGALHREEKRAAATERMLGEAFADLDQLMAKAGEMVKLAEAFRARTARARAPGDEEDAQMDAALAEELADLGLASPITRESCGKQYYKELARQVAAVMEGPVAAAGGVLPLPEVYRKFCRARFTDLVSPDDLLQAVRRLPEVGAPLRLREYPSGVKALVAAGSCDEAVLKAVVDLAAHGTPARVAAAAEGAAPAPAPWESALGPGVSRAEAAEALKVPLPVAGEHLAAAEAAGMLCRDDGPEGVRFFRNFFATAAA